MSKQRTGNFIAGGNPQVPSLTTNNGVFDSNEVYTAVNNNAWQPSGSGTYEFARSLRFRSGSSTYLERTPSVSSSRSVFTISLWTKWCAGNSQIFGVTSGSGSGSTQEDNRLAFQHSGDGQIQFYEFAGGGFSARKYTAARFRDPSAWYHIVARINYTEPSANNRIRIFVNGVEITAFSDITDPSLNLTSYMNGSGNRHTIGAQIKQFNNFYDGYLTEINVIDGQALDPSYFGYFDNLGIWQPKRYTGGYGANGFYLPFSENNSLTNLGRNFAGSNLVTYSEQFDNAAWSVTQGNISANAVAAPDGNTTADYLRGNTTNTFHYINRSVTVTASTRYTWSVYCKKADYDFIQIGDQGATAAFVYVNLNNGQLTSVGSGNQNLYNVTATTQFVGNGWYRITCSLTTGSSQTSLSPIIILLDNSGNSSFVGSTTAGTYIWGAQLNLGSHADQYIQTIANAANNDWTVNNISLTAGTTYDSMVDSPTNVFTTATDIGGVVSGNYCTWNSAAPYLPYNGSVTISNGNLTTVDAGTTYGVHAVGTFPMSSGKWYWEITATSMGGSFGAVGIVSTNHPLGSGHRGHNYWNSAYRKSNEVDAFSGTGSTSYGASWTTGDVIGIALDMDAGTLTYFKNGVSQGVASTGITGSWVPAVGDGQNATVYTFNANFGQRPFAYAPPAGFKSLNTTNLQALGATVTARAGLEPSKWFNTVLSSGNTTGRTVSGLGFQPDLVVFKNRDGTGNRRWSWFDSIRGPNNHLTSQLSDAEFTGRTDLLQSFNSDGFSVGADAAYYGTNGFTERWAQWAWKAGDTTVTNTSGSVSTQVRASATSGFSIATYTPPSSGSFTFGHGLPSAPTFIILKERTSVGNWIAWHSVFGSPTNQGFYLNSSISPFAAGANWLTGVTSTTVGITQGQVTSGANPHIVYSFIEVPGFSKIGSFVGNGSTDGPFVYCGFRPRFIMARSFTNGAFWVIHDTERDLTNPSTRHLYPHTSNAEEQLYSTFDILSNGFKCRNANDNVNYSGTNAIYIAFAESPFALNNRAR